MERSAQRKGLELNFLGRLPSGTLEPCLEGGREPGRQGVLKGKIWKKELKGLFYLGKLSMLLGDGKTNYSSVQL